MSVSIKVLKRSDLAKQFEEIVRQEIKVSNEAVGNMNIRFNTLQKNIDDGIERLFRNDDIIRDKSAKAHTESINKQEAIIEEIEAIKSSRITSASLVDGKFLKYDKNLVNELELYILKSDFDKEIKLFRDAMKKISLDKDNSIAAISKKVSALEKSIVDLKEQLSLSIMLMTSNNTVFNDQLEKKIDIAKVDKEGVQRELEILKKSLYIHDKKLENIYTLIERVKQEKQ